MPFSELPSTLTVRPGVELVLMRLSLLFVIAESTTVVAVPTLVPAVVAAVVIEPAKRYTASPGSGIPEVMPAILS